MPAKDNFHEAVVTGLQKQNWLITDDPLYIEFGGVDFYIDIGAERLIAAEKDNEKIAIEIKSFIRTSAVSEFHVALGQFMNYRLALNMTEPKRKLYLAIPENIYDSFFQLPFAKLAIQTYQLYMLVYSPKQQEIIKWLS